MEIARALQSVTPTKTFSVNTQTPLDKGYYVFTGDAFGTTTTNTMASSPIYALVTDSGITITEKSTLPTVLLNIQEDSTNLYSKAADHSFGQLVNYKATATLPINYASFNTYACDFNISANQYDFNTIDNNSISVYLDKDGDGNVSAADKITTGFTITKKRNS